MAQSKKYEILYIIRPDLDDESKTALVERFDGILRDNGAEVIESKDWSKRRLAFEIKNYREGLYHLIRVATDDDTPLGEFDRLSKINDDILRHMITREED
ncbi:MULTISPECIES: 30S ribosomal protein S6 [Loigolactobacillus]|uniref:Small ribosomal subunit protein bS6 n=1 Tax=Loigolactobacillus backii TaxID=375175 RepID=A0A192H1K7_9LACO|nr:MULTISPECIES: 30S ribosomal protein S6 [Loigolactobacillus]ANK60600.1 30S ribosomal protein S6 [Loigolactobacillus backii]ANK61831.1 30S ribosomal protein S6 [Loigolactobacillus backii]ANK65553.1 30S ribosomal protein S6 [Loigolactobacillus backii]ANK68024.1 30S ribosomal protein S6 [Loigolactobacillus backii]ANK68975.1 30S ribosomal protein S6 [Loigolactobacillus backii]